MDRTNLVVFLYRDIHEDISLGLRLLYVMLGMQRDLAHAPFFLLVVWMQGVWRARRFFHLEHQNTSKLHLVKKKTTQAGASADAGLPPPMGSVL